MIVLAPCSVPPATRLTSAARATPIGSTPMCSKKRESSAASTAFFTTFGTSSMCTNVRRSSPNSPISWPSAVYTRNGMRGR